MDDDKPARPEGRASGGGDPPVSRPVGQRRGIGDGFEVGASIHVDDLSTTVVADKLL